MKILWKIIKGFLMTIGLLWVLTLMLTVAVTQLAETETIDRSGPATLNVNS